MRWLVDRRRFVGRRRTVGSVCSQERLANCVEDHGEDGEDEGEQSPTGAEGGNDHCRRMGEARLSCYIVSELVNESGTAS